MAINDLTGLNIQDTYKRVLTVGEDGLMYDGTGSLYTPLSASHEITTELSSSHAVNADTASFATNFNVAGHITASGNISASGITAVGFTGSLTGDVIGNVTGDVIGDVTGDVTGEATNVSQYLVVDNTTLKLNAGVVYDGSY